jgi:hypothetical protein
MERANTKHYNMATKSIFQKLEDQEAIFRVPRDHVKVLKPQYTKAAIGVRNLDGCSCLVLMGTSLKSAIIMTHISTFLSGEHTTGSSSERAKRGVTTSEGEVHYMELLRRMVGVFIQEQELSQLPFAWGIFHRHDKDGIPLNHLVERTWKVFQHLGVKLQIFFCDIGSATVAQSSPERQPVVAVRHEAEVPEIYVDNRLVYPRVHSGSLALEFDRLGLRQIDYEGGDNDDHDEEGRKNGDDGIRSRGVEFRERQSKRKIHIEAHVGNECGGNQATRSVDEYFSFPVHTHSTHPAYSRPTEYVAADDHEESGPQWSCCAYHHWYIHW